MLLSYELRNDDDDDDDDDDHHDGRADGRTYGVPHAVPDAVPHAVPHAVTYPIPHAGPYGLTYPIANCDPHAVPHAAPDATHTAADPWPAGAQCGGRLYIGGCIGVRASVSTCVCQAVIVYKGIWLLLYAVYIVA